LPAGIGSAEATRLSINRNARTRKPQISEDASHDILRVIDDEAPWNIPPPLLDEEKQPDSKTLELREREEARADLPWRRHRTIRYRPKTEKEALNNTPIENRSLFSVKKRAPNPQIPEPGGCYSLKNSNARVFLFLRKELFIYGSGTWSLSIIEAFLPCWHCKSIPEPPEIAAIGGIVPNSLFGIAGSEVRIMTEMLDLTGVCR